MKEYFPHDFNARNDRKLTKLKAYHKMTGLGVYWSIVEMLYEEKGKMLLGDLMIFSDELRTDPEIVESVIKDFELFQMDEKYFWSDSVNKRLKIREEKSVKAVEAAQKRWSNKPQQSERNANASDLNANASKTDANAYENECERNAIKVKKSKVKKSINTNSTNTPVAEAPVSIYNSIKDHFLGFYKEKFGSDYYFQGKDGKKINELIAKIKFKIKEKNSGKKESTDEDILIAFKFYIAKALDVGDNFIKSNFSLSTLDSKFNDIYTRIKNHSNGQSTNTIIKPITAATERKQTRDNLGLLADRILTGT